MFKSRFKIGFTLVEMLVVMTILSVLIAVISSNFIEADRQKNDAKRKADLRNIQSALELFKNKYGKYPKGCNGATTALDQNNWSGQSGTSYACPSGSEQYITEAVDSEGNTRSFAEFMPVLPKDPKLNGADSGYVYTVNAEGTVYKIMALNTVEAEVVADTSVFTRCGVMIDDANECINVPDSASHAPINGVYNDRGGSKSPCNGTAASLSNDYALKGGYANGDSMRAREYYSDIIRCK